MADLIRHLRLRACLNFPEIIFIQALIPCRKRLKKRRRSFLQEKTAEKQVFKRSDCRKRRKTFFLSVPTAGKRFYRLF